MYNAFISYSHAADVRLAPALRTALHAFARPWNRMRALRVFRDKTSLSASPGLWAKVELALAESEYFLLLASPEAARSAWVAREVDWWLANREAEKLLLVVTGGDLTWDDAARDFDWTRTTAIPLTFSGRFGQEPRHVDLRWAKTENDLSLRNSQFREAILDLAATIHGRPKDDLDGDDVRQYRAFRRAAWAAGAALAVLTIATAGAAVYASLQKREADLHAEQARLQAGRADKEREIAQRAQEDAKAKQLTAEKNEQRATEQANLARSRELAALALSQLQEDPDRSVRLAREAARLSQAAEVEDALRQSLIAPFARTVLDHPAGVTSAVFTRDAKYVVTTTHQTGRLWDAVSGRLVQLLAGPETEKEWTVAGASVSRDAAWVFTLSPDGTARGWDVATGHRVATLEYHGRPNQSDFSPDQRWIYSHDSGGHVRVWMSPAVVVADLQIHPGASGSQVFAPDWTSRFQTTPAAVVNAKTGAAKTLLRGHTVDPFTVALSADGRCAITASEDGTARVWDVATGEGKYTIGGHVGRVQHASLDWVTFETCQPNSGARFALTSGFDDRSARVWELMSDGRTKNVAVLRGHAGLVTGAVFSEDGKLVVTASRDGTARIWNATWRDLVVLTPITAAKSLAFSAGAKWVASTGDRGTTSVWETATRRRRFTVNGSVDRVGDSAFSPDASRVVIGGPGTGAIVWDLATGRPVVKLSGHSGPVQSAAFSRDGQWIVTAAEDGTARVWQAGTRSSRAVLLHSGHPLSVAVFSPDGKWVVTAGSDTAEVWNWATATRVAECRSARQSSGGTNSAMAATAQWPITTTGDLAPSSWPARMCRGGPVLQDAGLAAFSADGKRVVSVDARSAHVRDTETWQSLVELRETSANVIGAAFSPNGSCVVTAGEDRRGSASAEHSGWLWDSRTGKVLLELRGHRNWLSATAFSADGKRVITSSHDRSLRMFAADACGSFDELVAMSDARTVK
jgi:WD40 repeat protein